MRSDGGIAAQGILSRPAALIESGPASGAMAAAALGRRIGMTRLLSFDMGGTTAKAGAIVDGVAQVVGEFEAAGATHSGRAIKGSGYPVRFPFVDLAEVSAGGGTIAWLDDAGSLRVGPLSAGADPGPACYGTLGPSYGYRRERRARPFESRSVARRSISNRRSARPIAVERLAPRLGIERRSDGRRHRPANRSRNGEGVADRHGRARLGSA